MGERHVLHEQLGRHVSLLYNRNNLVPKFSVSWTRQSSPPETLLEDLWHAIHCKGCVKFARPDALDSFVKGHASLPPTATQPNAAALRVSANQGVFDCSPGPSDQSLCRQLAEMKTTQQDP